MVTKLEKLKSELNATKAAYKLESEERLRLEQQVAEYEAERQKLINERNALQCVLNASCKKRDEIIDDARKDSAAYRNEIGSLERKLDDLAIANADYEMQLKQHREAANESHQEAVQLSKQLHEAKSKVDSFRGVIDRQDRDISKAIAAINQFLIVECGRDERPASVREMSIQERFVYHLLDVLNGK